MDINMAQISKKLSQMLSTTGDFIELELKSQRFQNLSIDKPATELYSLTYVGLVFRVPRIPFYVFYVWSTWWNDELLLWKS